GGLACGASARGREAGSGCAPPFLVPREPGGVDTRGDQGLLECQALLRVPGRPLVDRPQHAGADAGPWLELLDRGVRAVREQRTRVPQRAIGVRAVRFARPEMVGEIAV